MNISKQFNSTHPSANSATFVVEVDEFARCVTQSHHSAFSSYSPFQTQPRLEKRANTAASRVNPKAMRRWTRCQVIGFRVKCRQETCHYFLRAKISDFPARRRSTGLRHDFCIESRWSDDAGTCGLSCQGREIMAASFTFVVRYLLSSGVKH
ncbi:uncharacterized protein BDZ99DRAFT_209396 [Mytilinidion resinicola]|uniref:Uncharacterized protein n=1 Tax=Mytilinidion resinicola TaxID=574789 RepID=A0A6A6Y0Q8_9PEZI|nr:uncharacterized protein BDZ99DRAFT_209396 [Mytilinidion resinicola]KAF2802103.1 hypothetical protein BDZ99DRAFT_209396 [Mytilinidion resinicola]